MEGDNPVAVEALRNYLAVPTASPEGSVQEKALIDLMVVKDSDSDSNRFEYLIRELRKLSSSHRIKICAGNFHVPGNDQVNNIAREKRMAQGLTECLSGRARVLGFFGAAHVIPEFYGVKKRMIDLLRKKYPRNVITVLPARLNPAGEFSKVFAPLVKAGPEFQDIKLIYKHDLKTEIGISKADFYFVGPFSAKPFLYRH